MPFDHDPDDERPPSERLLPPEDRLWRHPSELGPTRFPEPTDPAAHDRIGLGFAAAGIVLVGAVVTLGALWLTRPARSGGVGASDDLAATATTTTRATTVSLPRAAVDLGAVVGPSVALLEVERDGGWERLTALWLDDDGTLVTASPALASAGRIYAIGADGRRQLARIAGTDAATGVTVLVTERTAGTPVVMAEGRPGDGTDAAIVAPSTDAGTSGAAVVAAVVRAVDRRAIVGDEVFHDALHLDHPVPAERVGAALVNRDGALVGMVVGNVDDGSAAAITPADTLLRTATALRDDGAVRRARLGIAVVDAAADPTAEPLGARITEVHPTGPGAAGLRTGDVVTAIDGAAIDDASDLVVTLRGYEPGDRLTVAVQREDGTLRVTLVAE